MAGVGALKSYACDLAKGHIPVELDHDDRLSVECLSEVPASFRAHPEAALVYSGFAQFNADGTANEDRFDASAGWVYTNEQVDGTTYLRCQAMAPYPHNVGYIWYAPNHVRAFRRSAHEKAGGYSAELRVLDDQDLMARLYEVGDFVHIDRLCTSRGFTPTTLNPRRRPMPTYRRRRWRSMTVRSGSSPGHGRYAAGFRRSVW